MGINKIRRLKVQKESEASQLKGFLGEKMEDGLKVGGNNRLTDGQDVTPCLGNGKPRRHVRQRES